MQQDKSSIYETFFQFSKVLSVFGILPFRVDGEDICARSVYYPTFFAMIYSVMFLILCFLGQQEPDAEESLLISYGNYTVYLFSLFFEVLFIIFNYLNRKKIASCLVIMHHFDCELQVGQMGEIVVFSCNLFRFI